MTQKDIADLKASEVDLKAGYITRKRSKTQKHRNVPVVRYALWPETKRLLAGEMHHGDQDLALLNASGAPLWQMMEKPGGGVAKIDNIKSAFNRLRKKTKVASPLKALKKTSAGLLRNNRDYSGLENLFLGHAPQRMSDRHYAKEPQALFDEALRWLGQQYGLNQAADAHGNEDA